MSDRILSRRRLLSAGVLGTGGLLLAGCDRLTTAPAFRGALDQAAALHMRTQRLIGGHEALARTYSEADLSPRFRSNGNSTAAGNPDWRRHAAQGFAQWALTIDGLVRRPLMLPLTALQALEQRDQITRHDCVEGWSAIGRWQGPRLGQVLDMAGLLPGARYIVFHCADLFGTAPYYESIDLIDAYHPQTLLAWRMNGRPLPIEHGAPVRLRVERQLGYKHAKYVMRIEARASLAGLFGGQGGYWEDRGYQWYGGI